MNVNERSTAEALLRKLREAGISALTADELAAVLLHLRSETEREGALGSERPDAREHQRDHGQRFPM